MGDSLTVTDVLLLEVMAEATYFLTVLHHTAQYALFNYRDKLECSIISFE